MTAEARKSRPTETGDRQGPQAPHEPPPVPRPVDGVTAGNARRNIEDLAFLLLAGAILVLPAWLRTGSQGNVEVMERAVKPVSIHAGTAPWYEWTLLEGIGEVRARRIVEYRSKHGPFRSAEDLARVPGMPAGWVQKALPYVTFNP